MKIKDVNFKPFTSAVSVHTVYLYHLNGVCLCQFIKILDSEFSNQDLFDQLAAFSKTYPELLLTAICIAEDQTELEILISKGKVAETNATNIVEGNLQYYKYPYQFTLLDIYGMSNKSKENLIRGVAYISEAAAILAKANIVNCAP